MANDPNSNPAIQQELDQIRDEIKTKKPADTIIKDTERIISHASTPQTATTQSNPYGQPKALTIVLRLVATLLFAWVFYVYLFPRLPQLMSFLEFVTTPLGFVYSTGTISWIVLSTTFLVIGGILIYGLPFGNSYSKSKTFQKWIFTPFIILMLIILGVGAYTAPTLGTGEYENQFEEATEANKVSLLTTWNEIKKCSFHTNAACMAEEAKKKEISVNTNTEYKITFQKPISTISTTDLSRGLEGMNHIITITDNIEILSISCYYDDEKVPFYTEEIGIIEEKTGEIISGITTEKYCKNLDKLPIEADKKETEVSIKSVLKLKLKTDITQNVPVLDYGQFLARNPDLDPTKEYSKTYLNTRLSKEFTTQDYETVISNIPIKITAKPEEIKSLFPILNGKNDPQEHTLTYEITKNPQITETKFAKLTGGEVLGIEAPEIISLVNPPTNLKINNEGTTLLNIRYTQGTPSTELGDKQVYKLKVNLLLDFERTDRFTLTIINENYQTPNEDLAPTAEG